MNFLKDLPNHLLRFIWSKSKKKSLEIEDYKIEYIVLNKFYFWLCNASHSNGMCITYQPTKTVMIFLTKSCTQSKQFRYTLFHEFIEGNCYIRDQIFLQGIKPLLGNLIQYFGEKFPELIDSIEKAISNNEDREHIAAILLEIDLAQREMTLSDFNLHLNDIMNNRL